ncbi:MAG TPA: ImcF-related family protein, partial [Gemmatimonadaceae bacterium]|nr:ImcF-related family protein [Gemmatimonadaceae bacterium]
FSQGESWVVGEGAPQVNEAKLVAELRARYTSDYIENWRRFLRSSSITRYSSVRDASQKLTVLSGNQSPLLTLFSIASRNTNVAPDVASVFQPVQAVMPPADTTKLIGPGNQPYMSALVAFQTAVDQAGGAPQQAPTALAAGGTAKAAVRTIAASFTIDQQGQVQSTVQKLMEDPISNAEPLLLHVGADQVNARARIFCAGARLTLGKFPFSPSSTTQASIAEVSSMLRPGSGSLWSMYTEMLQSSLQKQGASYQPVPGDIKLVPSFVEMFNRLAAFSDVLFAGGTQDPKMEFKVKPLFSDGTNGVQLQLEGDVVEAKGNNLSYTRTIDWPAPTHDARLSVLLGTLQANLVGPYNGPWATFQIFYAADSWQQVGQVSRAEWILRSGTQGISLPGGAPLKVSVEVSPANAANVLHRSYFSGVTCGDAAR